MTGPHCKTVDDKNGVCINIFACPGVEQFFVSRSNGLAESEKLAVIRSGICGDQSICCEPNGNFYESSEDADIETGTNTDESLLAKFEREVGACGSFVSANIHGGRETELSEFPWMAQLFYVHQACK